jgi:hypothetical protein
MEKDTTFNSAMGADDISDDGNVDGATKDDVGNGGMDNDVVVGDDTDNDGDGSGAMDNDDDNGQWWQRRRW